MGAAVKLIIFVTVVLSVNNSVLYYAIHNKKVYARVNSVGVIVFLISLIEIVAIGIYAFIHLRG